jgi:hypothetical protein
MPGCDLQHGSVRPFPILASPASPATPGRAHRRAGRPLDRPAPGHAGPPPRPPTPPRRRRRPHQRLVLCDRVLATLIVLRLQLPHQALAVLPGVDRATITRANGQTRPLLAARGFAVPGQPTLRLRTLADVRLRGGQRRGAAHRRHKDPGPPAPRPPTRPARVHLRQAQAAAPSSPPWSATARAAPRGPRPCARAACTTRPRSRPRASPTC